MQNALVTIWHIHLINEKFLVSKCLQLTFLYIYSEGTWLMNFSFGRSIFLSTYFMLSYRLCFPRKLNVSPTLEMWLKWRNLKSLTHENLTILSFLSIQNFMQGHLHAVGLAISKILVLHWVVSYSLPGFLFNFCCCYFALAAIDPSPILE